MEGLPVPDQYGGAGGAGGGGQATALGAQEQRILAEHQATMTAQRDQTAAMAALSDTGGGGAPQTEEQMIALAIRMSAMEASQRGEYAPTAEELEQTQLAVALSLSMADSDRAALGGDSSGESDDELTPPSSPYHGQFFNTPGGQPSPFQAVATAVVDGPYNPGAVDGPALPSYDEALVDEPQFTALTQPGGMQSGFLPSAPGDYDPSTHTIDIGSPEAAAAGMAELETYLQGAPQPQQGRP
jgi:hypothetical protein